MNDETSGRQSRPVEATVMRPTTDMISAIASEVKHAIALGRSVEYGVARGLEWGCWEPVFKSARTDEGHANKDALAHNTQLQPASCGSDSDGK